MIRCLVAYSRKIQTLLNLTFLIMQQNKYKKQVSGKQMINKDKVRSACKYLHKYIAQIYCTVR